MYIIIICQIKIKLPQWAWVIVCGNTTYDNVYELLYFNFCNYLFFQCVDNETTKIVTWLLNIIVTHLSVALCYAVHLNTVQSLHYTHKQAHSPMSEEL